MLNHENKSNKIQFVEDSIGQAARILQQINSKNLKRKVNLDIKKMGNNYYV